MSKFVENVDRSVDNVDKKSGALKYRACDWENGGENNRAMWIEYGDCGRVVDNVDNRFPLVDTCSRDSSSE